MEEGHAVRCGGYDRVQFDSAVFDPSRVWHLDSGCGPQLSSIGSSSLTATAPVLGRFRQPRGSWWESIVILGPMQASFTARGDSRRLALESCLERGGGGSHALFSVQTVI